MKKNKLKEYKLRLAYINKKLDFIRSFKQLIPELKRNGSSYKCKSPFNPKEKTPSFFVNPDKHLWHCFSTDQGGNDIVSFVMKRDEVGFREGLEIIERQFGIKPNFANKSILKSLIKSLNRPSEVEVGEKEVRMLYEGKLIRFLDKFAGTIEGDKFGYWEVKEYIFEEYDKERFHSRVDFDRFIKKAYKILRHFRPKNHGILYVKNDGTRVLVKNPRLISKIRKTLKWRPGYQYLGGNNKWPGRP